MLCTAPITPSRFLPKFKKTNVKSKKPKLAKKKADNPFPPEPTPRKEDLLMESGVMTVTTPLLCL